MDFVGVLGRVVEGTKWLDETHPGWEEKIDTDDFDMDDSHGCVIGNVMGSYWNLINLPGEYNENKKSIEWADAHGFVLMHSEATGPANSVLQEIWLDVIHSRLSGGF